MSTTAPAAAGEDTELTHRQIVTILVGLMMAMFLAALDQTIVSTAMRTIADDLGGFSLQAWATTAFLITSTISTPLYGKLSDIYGRKPFILFSIGIFIVGSVLCGIATSIYELAAFRAVQGIGAGGLFSLAFAIIGDVVPPRERAKYQGYFLAVFGTSSVLGPVLGGFFAGADKIVGITGWRWIFYINVPIAAAAFFVVMRFLHIPHRRQDHRIDWPGAVALIVCLVPLLTVAEQGREWGWGSGRSLLCYGIGALGLVLFLLAEAAYKDEALLPMRLFKGRTFSVASIASFILGMAMFGGLLTLPLYLQIVKGATPTKAGLMLLPLVLGIMTGSIVSGQTIARTGRYRLFPIVGSVLMLAALGLFSQIGADTPLWRTMLIMALMGLGLGGNMQPVITAVQNAANPREIGVATSTVTFFRSMGGTLGAAVFLSVLFSLLPDKIKGAFGAAQSSPDFQAAARAHPDQAQAIQQMSKAGSAATFNDTSFLNKLVAPLAHPFKVGFSDSMSIVFMVATGIMVAGLIVILFLPEIPLRSMSAAQQRAAEDAAESGAGSAQAPSGGAAPSTTPASLSGAAPSTASASLSGAAPSGALASPNGGSLSGASASPGGGSVSGAHRSSNGGSSVSADDGSPASPNGGPAASSLAGSSASPGGGSTSSAAAGSPVSSNGGSAASSLAGSAASSVAGAPASSGSGSPVSSNGDSVSSAAAGSPAAAGSAASAVAGSSGSSAGGSTAPSYGGSPTTAFDATASTGGNGATSAGGAHEADGTAPPIDHTPSHAADGGAHEAEGQATPSPETPPRHAR
ncbi:DHA2 family efflux MFS transporter permease subunit [Dactylosporangium sp. McL0621]|uniref:MDR family MFS transporter n=1 Tax=Dactylosporangium sp. McL0621 TaxID=3415678 RepID=UPI003CF6729F